MTATTESTITSHEAAQIKRANATKATPVVFVHGLWLLPSSWDRRVTLFEEAGYAAAIVTTSEVVNMLLSLQTAESRGRA